MLVGDAAHLVIPMGALGLHTGLADAVDLSWKLAAARAGWGGPELLPSSAHERRLVGERVLEASDYAANDTATWRKAATPAIFDDTPESQMGAWCSLRAGLKLVTVRADGPVSVSRAS